MSDSQERNASEQMLAAADFPNRRIFVFGDIDDMTSYRFIVSLAIMDRTDGPITIVLNSQGGVEAAGYAMYDAIAMCNNIVFIEGYGAIYSIAAAIFQAGDVRRMSPNTDFMIHNGSIGLGDDTQQTMIVDLATYIRKHNQKYHSILANRSKMSYADIEQACEKDTYYSAEEALERGFCDEIIKPLKKYPKRKSHRRKKNNESY